MNRTHIGLGLFILGTLGLLIWLAQALGAIDTGDGKRYELRLQHAAGLVQNNAVKIAGVQVGRIEKIGIDHDVAVLTLAIDDEVVLHEDTRAIVRAKSLLGEKYLQLHPGTRDAPVLDEGGEIVNVDVPFEIDQVLNALQPILGGEDSIASAIAPLAETLNDLLKDASGKEGGEPIISREEIRQIIEDTKATAATARRIAEENEKPIGEIVENTRKLSGDPRLPKIVGRVDSITQTVDTRLDPLIDRTEQTLAKLEKLTEVIDERRAKKIGTIIDDAAVATSNLRKASDDLDELTGLLRPLLKNLKTIADRASEIDGDLIRAFLQREGVKIFVGNRREAKKALEE